MISTLGRVLVVPAALLAVSALPAPYAAATHHGPPGSFGTSPSGPNSETLTGQQTTTQVTPGSSGSNGYTGSSSSSSSSSAGTSSAASGLWLNNSGGSACDPSLYPNGYAPGWALPSPCIQPTGGGRAPQAPAAPVITTQMVTDAARVTAPTSPPHVEPGNRSYVNIPNNYWTDAPTVRTSVTVLGRRIPLTWAPISTTWNFGDGGSATGNGVEDAAIGAPGAVEHAYERQGSYDISTTTTYSLTFVLPGQGAQTMELTSPPSPAVTLPVGEIQTLVNYAS